MKIHPVVSITQLKPAPTSSAHTTDQSTLLALPLKKAAAQNGISLRSNAYLIGKDVVKISSTSSNGKVMARLTTTGIVWQTSRSQRGRYEDCRGR